MIRIDNEQFWLYAAVDPKTNHILHVRLYSRRTTALTEIFLRELHQKHDVADALFLVDGAPWFHAVLHRLGLRFRHVTHGTRNVVEWIFREVGRRTRRLSNCSNHAEPNTAETWLQTSPDYQNALIQTLPEGLV